MIPKKQIVNIIIRKTCRIISFLFVGLFLSSSIANSQQLGATLCWHYKEMQAGASYPFNQSITKDDLIETEWWENIVEEVEYSGLDYVALLSRGYSPGRSDRGAGHPEKIKDLVNAMDRRAINSFKLAIFDDCPSSWTANSNYDKTGIYSTDTKFDCSDVNNYKYIWDFNLKEAIKNIPDERRYKINGRMVIIFWSVKSTWMTNMGNSNLKKILGHIREKCKETYGFNPYLVIARNWFDADSQCNSTGVADAVHNWFSSANSISYTNYTWNGLTTGVVTPGFGHPDHLPFIDPKGGQTLIQGLEGTVKSGASLTLCEGFTDAAESAAYWRSKDVTYYQYPNQRLNILRKYSKVPYPDQLKMEVEACDNFTDLTTGNSGGAFRDGNLDIAKTNDINGGWHVTGTQANEFMEWFELPMLSNNKFYIRYKSKEKASVSISIDGTVGSEINLPSTNDVWTTKEAGVYYPPAKGEHTVRLTVVSGSPDINYISRNSISAIPVTAVSLSKTNATLSPNSTLQLSATILPANATNQKIMWSTSNENVATVGTEGLVSARSPGTVTIWAIARDGEKAANAQITVTGSVFFDNCDQLSSWNSSAALNLNDTEQKQGANCIEFKGSTTDEFKKAFSPAYNSGLTSDNAVLKFWYFASDVSKCGTVRVELGSAGKADVDELSWPLTGLVNGWNQISLNISNATVLGSPNLNELNWFRIYNQKSGTVTTRIDGIEITTDQVISGVNPELDFEKNISVFPNPSNGIFKLKILPSNMASGNYELKIFDLGGKLIYSKSTSHPSDVIQIDGITDGVFILQISLKGLSYRTKLIVREQ